MELLWIILNFKNNHWSPDDQMIIAILLIEFDFGKKDIFLDIMRMAFDEKHNFLFLNIPTQRLFKNFDEIVIQDDMI